MGLGAAVDSFGTCLTLDGTLIEEVSRGIAHKVVLMVKALLEIDLLLKQQEDQAKSMSTASEMKEAA